MTKYSASSISFDGAFLFQYYAIISEQ